MEEVKLPNKPIMNMKSSFNSALIHGSYSLVTCFLCELFSGCEVAPREPGKRANICSFVHLFLKYLQAAQEILYHNEISSAYPSCENDLQCPLWPTCGLSRPLFLWGILQRRSTFSVWMLCDLQHWGLKTL